VNNNQLRLSSYNYDAPTLADRPGAIRPRR
jgi:hypothetical protein